MNTAMRTIAFGLAAMLLPGAACASTSEEWTKMAKDVELKCGEATAAMFRKSQVIVDPTGSENFGLAIVYGRSKAAKAPAAVICVYDKKTMKVEIGSELGKDVIRVRKPKPEGDTKASGSTDDTSAD